MLFDFIFLMHQPTIGKLQNLFSFFLNSAPPPANESGANIAKLKQAILEQTAKPEEYAGRNVNEKRKGK